MPQIHSSLTISLFVLVSLTACSKSKFDGNTTKKSSSDRSSENAEAGSDLGNTATSTSTPAGDGGNGTETSLGTSGETGDNGGNGSQIYRTCQPITTDVSPNNPKLAAIVYEEKNFTGYKIGYEDNCCTGIPAMNDDILSFAIIKGKAFQIFVHPIDYMVSDKYNVFEASWYEDHMTGARRYFLERSSATNLLTAFPGDTRMEGIADLFASPYGLSLGLSGVSGICLGNHAKPVRSSKDY